MSRQDIAVVLEGLSSPDADVAWKQFLEAYSGLIYQVAGLFEHDEDRLADCFLFVCEALHRDDYHRLRSFRPSGPATFETWLRAVVRNLSIDWRRSVFGRSRLLKVIDQQPVLEQQVFRCSYHLGLTAVETHGALLAEYPALTLAQVEEVLVHLHGDLSPRERWLVSTRRPVLESLEAGPAAADPEGERPLPSADPTPEADAQAAEARRRLTAALNRLETRPRLVLRLRFEQELSLGEVARLANLAGGPQGAARELERAVAELARLMRDHDGKGGEK